MHRRYNLAHLILCGVVVLSLTPLMVVVDAQAQIAFVSKRDGNPEIYVMDDDGKNQRRLTNNPHGDWTPSWSPDGRRIVFASERDGHFRNTDEIYVMDADGMNQRRLTNNPKNDWYPSWSPDGKRIAFASDRKGDWENFEIYVIDANGDNQQRLTNDRSADSSPSWSPDGKHIVFSSLRDGNSEIYVINVGGAWHPRRLTNNRHDDVSPAWFNSPFSVAPVGEKFTMWGWLKQVDR